jgi:acetoacetyl-CoA reductase/3-oxoacyl-[acyl-carrier protein] reductase
VGEASDARSVVKRVLEEWGRLDILVNNAAIRRDRSIRTTHDEWHEVMRVNLDGPYYMTTTAIPSMIQHKFGRIINISSYVAETGTFGQADYAACKGGLIAFTKVIALEMAKYNITANCLAPGFAMGRFGSSDDVAKAAGLLAAEADYITGQTINVNGGIYLT